MKKIAIKFLFFLPLALFIFADLISPFDQFTHRVWEAIKVMRSTEILSGHFYPLIHIERIDSGEMQYGTARSIYRYVVWDTDRFGFRKKEPYAFKNEILVLGDSNIAGSSQTQSEIFSEVLERKLKVGVYPLAPGGIGAFLSHPYFKKNPPRLVILGLIERHISGQVINDKPPQPVFMNPALSQAKTSVISKPKLQKKKRFHLSRWIQVKREELRVWWMKSPYARIWAIREDHFLYKRPLIQYMGNKINDFLHPKPLPQPFKDFEMSFSFLDANQDVSESVLKETVLAIQNYSLYFQRQGIRFIFLPIPNKENIYSDLIPSKKPVFLTNLILKLKEKNIEVIDTQHAFDRFRALNPRMLLYDPDETHWNGSPSRC